MNDDELFEEYIQQPCINKTTLVNPDVANLVMFGVARDRGYNLIERIRHNYGKDLPIPYIGYIDENVLNACAFIHKGKDFIGVNAGTLLILFDIFSRMLSHPKIFLNIGDLSREIVPEQYYDSIYDFRQIDQNDTVVPKDLVRMEHAFQLAMVAFDFLIVHEYGHLIFGHVYLSSEQKGVTNLFELEATETQEKRGIRGFLRQTLEMDADVFSANIGFRNVLANAQLTEQGVIPFSPFYASREAALYNWMFSIYTLFRLFGGKHNIEELELLDYPPPAVRAFYTASTIVTNYKPSGYPEYHFTDILIEARQDSEDALDKVFHEILNKETLTHEYIKAAQMHSSKLGHNWKNVFPLLQPLSRGNLAPVTDE